MGGGFAIALAPTGKYGASSPNYGQLPEPCRVTWRRRRAGGGSGASGSTLSIGSPRSRPSAAPCTTAESAALAAAGATAARREGFESLPVHRETRRILIVPNRGRGGFVTRFPAGQQRRTGRRTRRRGGRPSQSFGKDHPSAAEADHAAAGEAGERLVHPLPGRTERGGELRLRRENLALAAREAADEA